MEDFHLFDVHLGETVVPYATLEPLKAVLPLKQGDDVIPSLVDGTGGIRLSGLERRMRERWRTISGLWETYKAPANQLNLLGQLDYLHKLSSQLEWQRNPGVRPIRIAYSASGEPTATLVLNDQVLIDYTLFWVACKNKKEANYLLAIINSGALFESVKPLMPKGLFGPRHVQKHLWKLPIPEFDESKKLHSDITKAGAAAAAAAQTRLAEVRKLHERQGAELTVAIARRELRKWLRISDEGKAVESAVGKLLAGG